MTDNEKAHFMECAACAAQSGAPLLCTSCLNNRKVINRQSSTIERLESLIRDLKKSIAFRNHAESSEDK